MAPVRAASFVANAHEFPPSAFPVVTGKSCEFVLPATKTPSRSSRTMAVGKSVPSPPHRARNATTKYAPAIEARSMADYRGVGRTSGLGNGGGALRCRQVIAELTLYLT